MIELSREFCSLYSLIGFRVYGRMKLMTDPIYAAVHHVMAGSDLPLLDVGCGAGLLSFYLRSHGYRAPITGIDVDAIKIGAAREVAEHSDGLSFLVDDVRSLPPFRGNVALLDILHYFPLVDQVRMIESVIERTAPGGRVVIRECLREQSWRFRLTRLEERFARRVGWLHFDQLHFPSVDDLCAPFARSRFTAEIAPLWGKTPFNNYLLVFRAPHSNASTAGTTNS